MKCFRALFLLGLIFLLNANSVMAFRIKSGYEALEEYDYFKAKKQFSKSIRSNPSAAAFGLSTIYARNDNPFYNKDSAYRYILLADSTFDQAKLSKKERWTVYGWTRNGIDSLRQLISNQFYLEAQQQHSVPSYTEFVSKHPWAEQCEQATNTRDSLAFLNVVQENTSEAYDTFLAQYPTSRYADLAQDNFHYVHYLEYTKADNLKSYNDYLLNYPESPMKGSAELRVFEIATAPNTPEAYEFFVKRYSENSYIDQAWNEFFQVYLNDYSRERIEEFLERYPNAPNRAMIEQELLLADSLLLPVNVNGLYGYMNTDGELVIQPEFQSAERFHNGLAVVAMKNHYGAIDKLGKLRVHFSYDALSNFEMGRAIVEKEEKLGMIDRNSKTILPTEYEDIGEVSEGLVYFLKDEKYGYCNAMGEIVIGEHFNEAYSFSKGNALVEINGNQAIIDTKGNYIFEPRFEKLHQLSDSLYSFAQDDLKGIISVNGKVVVEPIYEEIGTFNDGLALVASGDTVRYINLLGQVVIDKNFRTFPNYLFKGEFNNGKAIVFRKGKYGKINLKGDIVTEIEHDNLGVGEKHTPFMKKELWGLLNESNKVVIPPTYSSLDAIGNRFVVAGEEDSLGLLDLKGNKLLPFAFQDISVLKDDFLKVRQDGVYGIYKIDEPLLGISYYQIRLFNDDFVLLINDDNVDYFDLKREQIIEVNRGDE